MTKLEKLLKAKELILEVEAEFLEQKGFCPYEIGYTLRNLDEAITFIQKNVQYQ